MMGLLEQETSGDCSQGVRCLRRAVGESAFVFKAREFILAEEEAAEVYREQHSMVIVLA